MGWTAQAGVRVDGDSGGIVASVIGFLDMSNQSCAGALLVYRSARGYLRNETGRGAFQIKIL